MLLTLPPTFRNMLSQIRGMVFMLYYEPREHQYYIQFCEGTSAREFHIETKKTCGLRLDTVFDSWIVQFMNERFDVVMTRSEDVTFEVEFRSRWFLINCGRVKGNYGAEGHIIGTATDITSQKQAEVELRAALEKERELNVLKSNFISTVSHEFRTPLTGIALSADLIGRYVHKMTDHERTNNVDKIKVRVDEIRFLIDSLLLQASSDSLKLMYDPKLVDVQQLLSDIVSDFTQSLAQQSHVLTLLPLESDFSLRCDSRLLRHSIRNLLVNAVKYSALGTEIALGVNVMDSICQIWVRDEGIGMTDDELQRVFTPFFRSKNVEKISGTGLGLSISKQFVELHGGVLRAESSPGCGTTFYVEIPHSCELPVHAASHRPGLDEDKTSLITGTGNTAIVKSVQLRPNGA